MEKLIENGREGGREGEVHVQYVDTEIKMKAYLLF